MTESVTLPAGQARTPVIDPRLPKLTEVPGFLAAIADGWGTPDRAVPMVGGAASAAAAHRSRLAAEFSGRSIVVGAGQAPVRPTTPGTASGRTAISPG
jgi:Xaa-Pro aminopeptidase